MKIGLLSDTHGYMDDTILKHLADSNEIWHAGDIGDRSVIEALEEIAPVKAVYGNIDGGDLRKEHPETQRFEIDGLRILMIHIAGPPGKYYPNVRQLIEENKPDVFICGHSHILKVQFYNKFKLLHVNPGAAGNHGFHKVRTLIRFEISDGKPRNMEVVELARRGT